MSKQSPGKGNRPNPQRTDPLSTGIPANEDAERMVLGSIILDNTVLPKAAAVLDDTDFFSSRHRHIWRAMLEMSEEMTAIEGITIANKLMQKQKLAEAGGMSYISTLTDELAQIFRPDEYIRIVQTMSGLRTVINNAQEAISKALRMEASPIQIMSDLDSRNQALMQRIGQDSSVKSTAQVIEEYDGGMRTFLNPALRAPALPTGFQALDEMLNGGLHEGKLIIIAGATSSGKSVLMKDIGLAVAKTGKPIFVSSQEMDAVEHIERAMISELNQPGQPGATLGEFKRGELTGDSWYGRLYETISQIQRYPIWWDDTAGLTYQEVANRIMVLAYRERIKLALVDYLQIMDLQADKYGGNEAQAISHITRSFKRLAKRLRIPIVLLSQFSRAASARKNTKEPRPQLSDLKGCLSGDTRILDPVSGRFTTMRELAWIGGGMVQTVSGQRITGGIATKAWSTGVQPVFILKTSSGREIKATANHPFLTPHGWKRLDQLSLSEEVAGAFRYSMPALSGGMNPVRARILGYMIGNGSYRKSKGMSFCSGHEAVIDDFVKCVADEFPDVTCRKEFFSRGGDGWWEIDLVALYDNGYGKPFGNPMREWIRSLGMIDDLSYQKKVPDTIRQSGRDCWIEFLSGYFLSDGCISVGAKTGRFSASFNSTSRELLEGCRDLLCRIGVASSLSESSKKKDPRHHQGYILAISADQENERLFATTMRLVGKKAERAAMMLMALPRKLSRQNLLSLPVCVSAMIERATGRRDQGKRPHRSTAIAAARESGDAQLIEWATSDLLWEQIESIYPAGSEEVFDLEVPGTHCFVANGLVVHNSSAIEQDADVIIFPYRPEMDLPNRTGISGRAEFIIRKQRGGRTGTVDARFEGPFVRFRSLTQAEQDEIDRERAAATQEGQ